MKKKFITGVWALSLALASVPAAPVFASDTTAAAEQSVSDVSMLRYHRLGNEIVIDGCDRSVKELIIPDRIDGFPVRSIGSRAFDGYSLEKVVLPENITKINMNAFANNMSLTSISLPSTLSSIGDYAFYGCISLKSIEIPERVSAVGENTFLSCSALENVTLPSSLKEYPENLLRTASSLKTLTVQNPDMTMPEGDIKLAGTVVIKGCDGSTAQKYAESMGYEFESLGEYVPVEFPPAAPEEFFIINEDGTGTYGLMEFKTVDGEIHITDCDMNATNVVIPDSINDLPVTHIDKEAFGYCRELESIKLPDTLTYIGNYAFTQCESLRAIEFPESLEYIGSRILYLSQVTSVSVPASAKTICDDAFWGSPLLSSINVDKDNPNYFSVDGVLYNTMKLAKKTYTYLTVYPPAKPDTSFDIPDYVSAVKSLAFYNAANLEKVTMSDNTGFSGGMQFSGCTSLKNIQLSKNIREIGVNTFASCPFDELIIPDSVTTLKTDAFYGCGELKSLCIPSSVTAVKGSGMTGADKLTEIYIMNPDCVIEDKQIVLSTSGMGGFGGTIYGYIGSTAQAYAEKHGFNFADITEKAAADKYDINLDGAVSIADAVVMQKYLLGARELSDYQLFIADALNDKSVDIYDFVALKKLLTK